MLKQRTITAVWTLALVIAAIWFDGLVPWLTLLVASWGVLAGTEVYRLTGVSREPVLAACGLASIALFVVSPHLRASFFSPAQTITLVVVFSLLLLLVRSNQEGIFAAWSWMIAGSLYLGWLMSFLVRLRLDAGKEWVVLAFFSTFASDSAAFLVGRAVGRHRLAPRISPGKTWEGAVAGLIASAAVSLGLVALIGPEISLVQAGVFGLIVGAFGQLGGLVASLLKRNTGVKDSGSMLPGHGGVLDRADSVIFAGVAAYAFFLAVSHGWLSVI